MQERQSVKEEQSWPTVDEGHHMNHTVQTRVRQHPERSYKQHTHSHCLLYHVKACEGMSV